MTIPEADCTVAEYGENRHYDPGDPVVEVVYPLSVRTSRAPARYTFPLSRLAKPGSGTEQATLTAASESG